MRGTFALIRFDDAVLGLHLSLSRSVSALWQLSWVTLRANFTTFALWLLAWSLQGQSGQSGCAIISAIAQLHSIAK